MQVCNESKHAHVYASEPCLIGELYATQVPVGQLVFAVTGLKKVPEFDWGIDLPDI